MKQKPEYIDPDCGLCHGKGRTKGYHGTQQEHMCPRCLGYGEFATTKAIAARKAREAKEKRAAKEQK